MLLGNGKRRYGKRADQQADQARQSHGPGQLANAMRQRNPFTMYGAIGREINWCFTLRRIVFANLIR